jgi:hypothetical protein
LTEARGNLVIRYKKEKEKEKENGGKMLVLGHCLKARNGIRNTFSHVSFSKLGTDSAPIEKNRKRAPVLFILQSAQDSWPRTDEY